MVSITASKPPSVSDESTRQTMLACAKHGRVCAFIALMAFNLAAILAPLSAMAESPDVSARQEVAGSQDQAPQSLGMKISWPSIIVARPRGTGGQPRHLPAAAYPIGAIVPGKQILIDEIAAW